MTAKAAMIAWPSTLNSRLACSMNNICCSFDISLQRIPLLKEHSNEDHINMIKSHKNVICWISYAEPQEKQKINRNVLFIENCLLYRGISYYLDDNGHGHLSNIVSSGDNIADYSKSQIDNVYNKLLNFGWKKIEVKNNSTILIALQSRNVQDKELLESCEKYLPQKSKVIIRQHPRKRKECYEKYFDFFERNKNWEIDNIDNEFDSMSRCSHLVSNSSSLMYKALFMGITVASCNQSYYTNSPAILDCSRNNSLLADIFNFKYNEKATQNLLCALDKHSVSTNTYENDLLVNTNFANWLIRINR